MEDSGKPRRAKAKVAKSLKGARPKRPTKPKSRAQTDPPSKPTAPVPPESDVGSHLAQLRANPGSAGLIKQTKTDIEQQGLETFFRAMMQTSADTPTPMVRAPTMDVPVTATSVATAEFMFVPKGDVGQTRRTWQNHNGSQVAQPLRLFKPTTLTELRSIIQQAALNKCKVKAAGSGHSFTDVATTTDFLIDTHGLNHPLPLEADVLKSGVDRATLFETEGGIVVRDLNEALWNAGLGLTNMGGYDGQTIMGVVSTSTHGSGVEFGPLSGLAMSLTLVVSSGDVIRVEPKDGITDPIRWAAKHPDIKLIQDDDWYYSCQVGIGCMGVVYSLVLQVRQRYWMKEERTLSTWSKVKQDLQAGLVFKQNRHYEVLVNPYLTNGEHTCLVTRRNPVPQPTVPPHQLPHRNYLVELFARFPGSASALLNIINAVPQLVPNIIDAAMQGLAVDYVDRSYRVFNIGAANDAPAYGSEIGFPMNTYLDATEHILQIAAHGQRVGNAYLTSPFSLRFVKASQAYLSMMHETDTCMIEFPMLDNTIGGKELLRRIEYEMYALGGRPHWGLLNFLSGGNGLIESMYPKYSTWLSVFKQLNPDGMFDNAFTDRCGISKHTFVRK